MESLDGFRRGCQSTGKLILAEITPPQVNPRDERQLGEGQDARDPGNDGRGDYLVSAVSAAQQARRSQSVTSKS